MTLEAYYIDIHPVTNYQYGRFIKETGHRTPILLEKEGGTSPAAGGRSGMDDARLMPPGGKSLPTEPSGEGRPGTDKRWWPWVTTLPGSATGASWDQPDDGCDRFHQG